MENNKIEKLREKIVENNIEKSLVKKGENSLRKRTTYTVSPMLKTTAGVLFYVASFVVSMAASYTLIFSLFN